MFSLPPSGFFLFFPRAGLGGGWLALASCQCYGYKKIIQHVLTARWQLLFLLRYALGVGLWMQNCQASVTDNPLQNHCTYIYSLQLLPVLRFSSISFSHHFWMGFELRGEVIGHLGLRVACHGTLRLVFTVKIIEHILTLLRRREMVEHRHGWQQKQE